MTRVLGVVLVWSVSVVPAHAMDYGKIERRLGKEPAYQTAPKYALLLFGPNAALRIWAVIDGETLYLDRNADGDLTAADERFAKYTDAKNIELADADGKTKYVITGVGHFLDGDPPESHLMVSVDIKGAVNYSQYSDAPMRADAKNAPVSHFHGPLSAGPITINWKLPPNMALRTGEKPTELPCLVGTLDGAHGCWVVVRSHHKDKSAFPDGVFPVVDIEFPPRSITDAPIKKRYAMDKFC